MGDQDLDVGDVQHRIDEGKALLCNVESLKSGGIPLPGCIKLANRIKSEIKFLSKIIDGKIPLKPCHMTSTNLGSLRALLHVVNDLSCHNISAVLYPFKTDQGKNTLSVDVVAGNGLLWVKVIARNAAALHTLWKGQGQFGERSLIAIAREYLRTAKCHPVDYQTPKVAFSFANGVPLGLAKELSGLGVLIDGDIDSRMYEDSDSENETNDVSKSYLSPIKLREFLKEESKHSQFVKFASELMKLNLDISSMLTLISNLSNGNDQFVYGIPVLDEQAAQERKAKVLPKLEAFMERKSLIACETALRHFKDIVDTIGGSKEKQRAKSLLEKVTVVEDNPSSRTLNLISSSKLNERSKVIFGTGDTHHAVTVTANIGFVRAALQNGVRYSVFEHEPRALTELKEK